MVPSWLGGAMKGVGMGIKDIYFALEDRYYDAVEALHLNKIVDTIDRVVPSFAVVLAVVFLIVAGGLIFTFSQPSAPPTPASYSLTLSFSGQNGDAIANQPVSIQFADDTTETLTTKSNGSIAFKVKPAQSPIRIALNAAGYLPYSQEYAVTKSQSISIVLEGAPLALEGISRTILVQDEQGLLLGTTTPASILAKFSCSNNPASAPNDITASDGTINVSAEGDCGRLTVRIIASSYREKTAELFNAVTEMRLTAIPVQVQQGSIAIAVKQASNNQGIAAAQVRLYAIPASGSAQLENQGITDSSGTFVFSDLNPGKYYITATKQGFALGQTPQQQLNAGQTTNLSLTLSASNNNKKFLVKTQNSSGVAIPQAVVNAFISNSQDQFILYTTGFTDSNGIFSELVGDINNAASALVVTHPNYVTEIVDPATLVAASDTAPLVVVMDAVTLGSNGLPTNAGNATAHVKNEVNFPVQSATAKLFADDLNGLLINTLTTDSSGNALFRNLPSGPYQARATKGNLSGNSTIQSVSNAQNRNFPITLVTNQGGVEVVAVDALTLAPLADANVQFLRSGTPPHSSRKQPTRSEKQAHHSMPIRSSMPSFQSPVISR
ncbi:MAG: carboxypeptidase regulatory-like domain-containing protein [Candidatus Iainarchaeum archaeon]|uniref:Carboxypeptidase regulatory-like domain-containing protein n=1 Tax=Candidatus Iainarchaeum sp. TaxID=3101447 RepID=A0A7T9DIZ8_9ARCH|nr:MAG: carboxypeptidase regulatory-like domain-containing protein [Candidatus Diapherotrites archaeon]